MSTPPVTSLTIVKTKESGKRVIDIADNAKVTVSKKSAAIKFIPILKNVFVNNKQMRFDEIIIGSVLIPTDYRILFDVRPYASDSATQQPPTRANVCFELNALPDDMRRAMEILEGEFRELIATSPLWSKKQPANVGCHIRRVYSEQTKDQDKVGKEMPRPILDVRADFGKFPANFGPLSNKPRTMVYEWKSRSFDSTGNVVFKERLDASGRALNADNCSTIIKAQDVVRQMSLMLDSIVQTALGVYLHLTIHNIYLETLTEGAIQPIMTEEEEAMMKAAEDKAMMSASASMQQQPSTAPSTSASAQQPSAAPPTTVSTAPTKKDDAPVAPKKVAQSTKGKQSAKGKQPDTSAAIPGKHSGTKAVPVVVQSDDEDEDDKGEEEVTSDDE